MSRAASNHDFTEVDNTDFAQELPSEIVPKTIPPEVCIDNEDNNDENHTILSIPDNPYDGINFVERHPVIKGADGVVKFDQVVSFPDFFSEQSVKVVASKYLCNNAKRKETDLRDMIDRVSDTTAVLAKKDGYVDDEKSFANKLKYYQTHQYSTFNSPVYFNQGIAEKNQLSACFILSVEDNMESIANLYKDEMMVFKKGSGSGVNFSPLRSSFEKVGKADKSSASGPISFLKASDTSASVVKSGGILRRAAKMACLNADHPDIFKFINCKKKEEDKLNAIKAAGILPEASYELSDEVFFQSSNLSVRFSNKFMEAVESDGYWSTREVLTGDIVETVKARDLLMQVSEIAHKTGDPGVMFHDTINDWNTTPADGTINASNPCVVGDTLLRSPEGDIKIRDLVESGRTEIPVYCCDPATGEVHIRMGRNPRKTGEHRKVYKVTFSKGRGGIRSITVTDNHKFLDSDGNTILCKDLVFEGKNKTRLMPFNKLTEKYRTAGGKETYIYNRAMKIKESHLILNWKNGSKINFGRMNDEYAAHHIDENHLNNHPDNLVALLNSTHNSSHSAGENNPRYGVKVSDETKKLMADVRKQNFRENGIIYDAECEWCGSIFETSKTYARSGNFCSQDCRIDSFNAKKQERRLAWIESVKHKCPHCDTVVLSNAVTCGSDVCISKAVAKGSDYINVSYDRKRAAIASIMSKALNLGASFICEGFDINTPNNWDMFLDADLETFEGSHRVTSRIILKYWGNWSAFINAVESRNHIVMDVEYVGEEDVYNITVDEFHTVAWGEIITKNCGEYNGQDNTSCNLAALNLIKFFKLENGRFVFDYDRYYDVVSTMIIAQDVFVDNASYPTEKLTQGTKRFRALGFGPANLGGLLLYLGIPYDSDKGRIIASLLTSIITGIGHITSAEIAKKLGPGEWWDNDVNKDAIYRILNKHKQYTDELPVNKFDDELIVTLYEKAVSIWNEICKEKRPLRCSQISLAMPNGTTGFLMGSSGFGIEPLYSNVIYKTLSGSDGAVIKMVNDDIRVSLQNLGYADDIIIKIISEIVDEDIPFEKSKYLKSEHVAIFDTAAVPENGTRYISADGHIGMLQAIQPFISGGISKTINLPNTTTVEDIYNIYLDCWRKGLKSVTVYRDGSKTEQIMSTKKAVDLTSNIEPTQLAMSVRKKMPSKRSAETNKFTIHGVEGKLDGYITRGLYPNGDLGEVFIELAKDGSTVKGLVGAVVTLTSISLQYGVPLVELVEKMIYRRFEPSGWVKGDEHIRQCSSIVDYIFRHLAHNHLSEDDLIKLGLKRPSGNNDDVAPSINNTIPDLSFCPVCNTQLRKLGTCTWCINCSWSDGSCS